MLNQGEAAVGVVGDGDFERPGVVPGALLGYGLSLRMLENGGLRTVVLVHRGEHPLYFGGVKRDQADFDVGFWAVVRVDVA